MKALVIIPTTKLNYDRGISAPLAWMFHKQTDRVYGIYGFELDKERVRKYDFFIIELNWYTELYEFTQLVDYIRKNNKNAAILFGGLFASLVYKKILEDYNVDYYIKGDNEAPLQMLLDDYLPETIPNFTGRNFDNPVTYVFKTEDYKDLDFNLDWFPGYFQYLKSAQQNDVSVYSLPMLITSKGGCTAVHQGCEYCMGAYHDELETIYARKPVVMDNDCLIHLVKKIEKKFRQCCLYIISRYQYNFTGCTFNVATNIEIDSPVSVSQVENIFAAFKKCNVLIPVYEEGVMGSRIINYKKYLRLEDENHTVKFPAYSYDKQLLSEIPRHNIAFSLDNTFAVYWAYWEVYKDYQLAYKNSKSIYNYFVEQNFPVFHPADE